MWPNLQFPADLVKFTDEILNGKLHFLCNGSLYQKITTLKKDEKPNLNIRDIIAIELPCLKKKFGSKMIKSRIINNKESIITYT